MQRIELESAFVLHQRPYQNTSLLLELFSKEHGIIGAVARSARGPKSRFKGRLQLFTPLLASWYGRYELKTLTQAEWPRPPFMLENEALLCGFYLNELLMKLLHRDDPHPQIFSRYQETLEKLQSTSTMTPILRAFEKSLLLEIGYGLPLQYEAATHEPIVATEKYQYVPAQGFFRCDEERGMDIFSGECLMAVDQEDWCNVNILKDSKRLMRMAIAHLLGNKVIKSRELL